MTRTRNTSSATWQHQLDSRVNEAAVVPERRSSRPGEDAVPVVERVLIREGVEQVTRADREAHGAEPVARLEVKQHLPAELLLARLAQARRREELPVVGAASEHVRLAAAVVGRQRAAPVRPLPLDLDASEHVDQLRPRTGELRWQRS